jgi:hypothetical protein
MPAASGKTFSETRMALLNDYRSVEQSLADLVCCSGFPPRVI